MCAFTIAGVSDAVFAAWAAVPPIHSALCALKSAVSLMMSASWTWYRSSSTPRNTGSGIILRASARETIFRSEAGTAATYLLPPKMRR